MLGDENCCMMAHHICRDLDKRKGEIENMSKHFVARICLTFHNDSYSTLLVPVQCPSTAKELLIF